MDDVTTVQEAHHANVGERLAFLEKAIGDSVEKHAQDILSGCHCSKPVLEETQDCQELAAAHSKLSSMHARLSACEATGELAAWRACKQSVSASRLYQDLPWMV